MNSEIIRKIKNEFAEKYAQSKIIQGLLKSSTFLQADDFTKQIGSILGQIIKDNIPDNIVDFADVEFIRDLLTETLGENHRLINRLAADIQKQIDEKRGIHINPQQAYFPVDRINNLAAYTAERDLTKEPAQRDFVSAIENINNSIYDDFIKKNADFRSKAGFRVTIKRIGSGCCEWCSNLVGQYTYSDVPDDIWSRHKVCDCVIYYTDHKTGRTDNSDKKDGKKIKTTKQTMRLTPEQARAREREILAKKPLTFGRKSDIINAGAISGALSPDSPQAQNHADMYYESVRHMKTDINRISENTGFDRDVIKQIKNHVFIEKHDLGNSEPEYFYPSYEMAESWQRLIDGENIKPHDITLLNHEKMEHDLMIKGYSQQEAHRIAEQKYNYGLEAKSYYAEINKHKK